MPKTVGIDLGTTNSVVAIKQVQTEVLKNSEDDYLTPSCVGWKQDPSGQGHYTVGKHAREWLKQDPQNTILAVKRLMGRHFHDPAVQRALSERKLRYRVKPHSRGTDNSIAVVLGGKEHSPEEISAKILAKIKEDAEARLGGDVDSAVITVPSYFNDQQKHATRLAAALAGLKVRRLLPEPTAAAISFGVDQVAADQERTVMVFDLGGGTFDLSVLIISGGQLIEQGKGGDMWLGGEDIDHLIIEHVLRETAREQGIPEIDAFISRQPQAVQNRLVGELKSQAERAKIRLSTEETTLIEVFGILTDEENDPIQIQVELTRAVFDEMIAPIVRRTVELARQLIQSIHLTQELISDVLLVGGSSSIPSLIEALCQEFGAEKVHPHPRPMLAIAEGAAVLSHRLADSYECPQCGTSVAQAASVCLSCGFNLEQHTIAHGLVDIVHSAAHDYYLYLEGKRKHLLVEKNTPLPFHVEQELKLVDRQQRLVHMKFFNLVNEVEESIGDLWLGVDLPRMEESSEPLRLQMTLDVDENNTISVGAAIKEHPEIRIERTLSRGTADEQIFLRLEALISEANRARHTHYLMSELEERALATLWDTHKVIKPETGEIDEESFQRAQRNLTKAERFSRDQQPIRPTLCYYEVMLDYFGYAIDPSATRELLTLMNQMRQLDAEGTYEELLAAKEALLQKGHEPPYSLLDLLMSIKKAGSYCAEHDPSRAPKFFRALEEIEEAYARSDLDRVHSIIDEHIDDATRILRRYEATSRVIHTELSR
jgi:molecular chaperone DnaK